MGDNKPTSSGGFSFTTVLFIVFLVLKLTHTIDWSWWWVTSPLWIGWALVLLIIIIAATISSFK
jgi:hypothetical protein